ncbi:MAG: ATP-binding protein, partial [candidate division WOR-3 bacterium]
MENFTAFSSLDMEFSPGINVFIGPNATGKTHILKIIYAVMSALERPGEYISKEEAVLQKIANVFLPHNRRLGRLVRRARGGPINAEIKIYRGGKPASVTLQSGWGQLGIAKAVKIPPGWFKGLRPVVYLPPKEILSNAPGFLSLYKDREIHFEEVYADLLHRAYLPKKKGPPSHQREELLKFLKVIMVGRKVLVKGEHFFFVGSYGENLEFSLLAEGIRKLALIWLLVQNETLLKGSTLFWDEPEANLNPSMLEHVADILLTLQRMGVQVFAATHSYV